MASVLCLVNRGDRTSRSRLAADRGCRSTITSRDQRSPPSAKGAHHGGESSQGRLRHGQRQHGDPQQSHVRMIALHTRPVGGD